MGGTGVGDEAVVNSGGFAIALPRVLLEIGEGGADGGGLLHQLLLGRHGRRRAQSLHRRVDVVDGVLCTRKNKRKGVVSKRHVANTVE